jgi:AcrR family transcriptional regulator
MKMATHQERRSRTQQKLLASARTLFAARGATNVSAEEIVKHAGLTRGALYHHFNGKEGLFQAVYEQLLSEINQHVEKALANARTPREHLLTEGLSFLETVLDPEVRQIVYLDAPKVLPLEVQRALDEPYCISSNRRALERLGTLEPAMIAPLAAGLFGLYNELALWVARAEDPPVALRAAQQAMVRLLEPLATLNKNKSS